MTEKTIKERNISEYITGKRFFNVEGCGTDTHYVEITQGEYEKYSKMESRELYDFAEEHLISMATKCGYGFYGVTILVLDGVPFLGITSGNTCD